MQTVTFSHPFREAQSLVDSTIATTVYHLALAGRGYVLDLASNEFLWESMDYMRQQQDSNGLAGEGSLSNLDLWRRSFRSWHLGAGQERGDDESSSPFRFDTSKGIDPWTKWRLSMLPDANLGAVGAATPSALCLADGTLIYQAGQVFKYTTDGDTWSDLVTLVNTPITQAVSDGSNLYVGCDNGKIKQITSAGITSEPWAVTGADVVAVSKGRVWAGAANVLNWMVPGSATVTAHVTVPFTGWTWTAICEGSRATYAAGYQGDKSSIYRIPFKADGSGLDAGVIAASLPDGEIAYSLCSYLGYILIGTSRGVRFAVADANGDLTYGAYIATPNPVRAFEPQDRFVWFGWSDYDEDSTGLGRVDLSSFTSDLTPAYASDLMYLGQGTVSSVATFADRRFFAVDGVGVVGQLTTPVPSATLTTSAVTFDLDNDKIATLIDVTHEPLDGTLSIGLVVDGEGGGTVAESSQQGSTGPISPYSLNAVTAHSFALTFTMVAGALATGPALTGVVFSAHPVPPRGERFVLPLMIREQIDQDGQYLSYIPPEEVQFLRALVKRGESVSLQIGNEAFNVFPANYKWIPYRQTADKSGWTGTCIMELREVTQ
jgi:hypothetical protein